MRLPHETAIGLQSQKRIVNSVSRPSAAPRLRPLYKLAASALAIAAAFGWNGKADAANDCGPAPGGSNPSVTCNGPSYPTINYDVDDLTISVGSDGSAVSVGPFEGIVSTGDHKDTVITGGNVTINSRYNDGINVQTSQGADASARAEVYNAGHVNSHNTGINTYAHANGCASAAAYTGVINTATGNVSVTTGAEGSHSNYAGIHAKAYAQSFGFYTEDKAVSSVTNAGRVVTGPGLGNSPAVYANASVNAYSFFGSAGNASNPVVATVIVQNQPNPGPLPFQSFGNIANPAILSYGNNSAAVDARVHALVEGANGAYGNSTMTIYNAAGGTIAAFGSNSDAIIFDGNLTVLKADGGEGGMVIAHAVGNITNMGRIYSEYGDGITGRQYAAATDQRLSYTGNATGATASSVLTIANFGIIDTPLDPAAVDVDDVAIAFSPDGAANATAQLIFANAQDASITSGGTGVNLYASANARSFNGAYDSTAIANVTAGNSGTISAINDGLYAQVKSYAYGQHDATAESHFVFSNVGNGTGGSITSTFGYGIDADIEASARIDTRFGNVGVAYALAQGTIISDDTIHAGEAGIYTWAEADSDGGGSSNTSSARVSQYVHNTGAIVSGGDGIYAGGKARAYNSNNATAVSVVGVVNGAPITAGGGNRTNVHGIYVWSEADAYGAGNSSASATASVTNSGAIKVFGNSSLGVYAFSRAYTYVTTSGSAASSATASVNNSGNVSTYGNSSPAVEVSVGARAKGAYGGVGNLTMTIYNAPGAAISAFGRNSDAIDFNGNVSVLKADGGEGGEGGGTVGLGGTVVAHAYGSIVNKGRIYAADGDGISGTQIANATDSNVYAGNLSSGGATASSILTITNFGVIDTPFDPAAVNVDDLAVAYAPVGPASATAGLTFNNAVGASIISGGTGVELYASASAHSYNGNYNSTAVANVTTGNSGTISAAFDGIDADVRSYAFGEHNATALSSFVFSNVGNGTGGSITATSGNGVYADVRAQARVNTPFGNIGVAYSLAQGTIISDDTIHAGGTGLGARLSAYTNGDAQYQNSASSHVSLYIHNTGPIVSGDDGIHGYGRAVSIESGNSTATSSIIVVNTGNITAGNGNNSYSRGIFVRSRASAYSAGSANASAVASVVNRGTIKVLSQYSEGVYTGANSYAAGDNSAVSGTNALAGGNASGARAVVFNYGTIMTYGIKSPGVVAVATATTYGGNTSNAHAYAHTYNNGLVSTVGNNSTGVSSIALAYAGDVIGNVSRGGGGGCLSETALVDDDPHAAANALNVNKGTITTLGNNSIGLLVFAGAVGGQYNFGGNSTVISESLATTNNSGNITTGSGNGSTGTYAAAVVAVSGAVSNLGNVSSLNLSAGGTLGVTIQNVINDPDRSFDLSKFEGDGSVNATSTATTIVVNSGNLTTNARNSAGIVGVAFAYSYGNGNHTAVATAIANITNSGRIVTQGAGSYGVAALALSLVNPTYEGGAGGTATSTINITNSSSITTHGGNATGIVAVALAGVENSATGNGNATIHIVTNGNINAPGVGADGIFALAVGQTKGTITIDLNGGSVMGGVVPSSGLHTTISTIAGNLSLGHGFGIDAQADGPITITNHGIVGAVSDQAIGAYSGTGTFVGVHGGGTGNVTITNAADGTIIGLVHAYGANATLDNSGTWVVRGAGSRVQAAATSDYSSTDGYSGVLGSGNVGRGLVINETGAKMLIVGNQQINLSTLNNMGLISLAERDTGAFETGHAGAATFETLVVGGDFVGGAGSKLAVDVDLNTGHHDFVQINGNASGSTAVEVIPTGSTPQATTGNGIPIVGVQKSIVNGADTFQLIGSPNTSSHTLVAGLYEYDLNMIPGNSTGATWYLQSHIAPPAFDFADINAGALAAFGMANASFGDLLSNLPVPDIQGAYNGDYPKLASADDGFIPGRPSEVGKLGFWGRFVGNSLDVSPHDTPVPFNVNMGFGQMGIDYTLEAGPGGALMVGAFGGYGDANLDFSTSTASASVRGGVYGGYGVFTLGKWEGGVLASVGDTTLKYSNPLTGTAFSVAPGSWGISGLISTRFDLGDDIFIQPRVEYSFARVDGFNFVDSSSTAVAVSGTESSVAIFGIRLGKTFRGDDGIKWAPYLDASVNDEFAGDTTVTGGGALLTTSLSGVNAKIGGGINIDIMSRLSLFARAEYVTGETQEGVSGFAGLRFIPSLP